MMSQKNNSYSVLSSMDKKVDRETKKTNRGKQTGGDDYRDYDIPNRSYGDLYCEVCDSHMNSEPMWDSHISGKRHQKNKKKDSEADKKYTHLTVDAICQKQFDNLDAPIVGLDNLCEIRRPGSKPFYQCYLCCATVPTVHALIEHVTNQKHLSAYLKDKDPARFSTIMSSGLGIKHLTPLIVECSIELEKSHGRGKVKVKKENPKPPDEYSKYRKDNEDFARKKRKLEEPTNRGPDSSWKQDDSQYDNRGMRQMDERYHRDENEELLKDVAIYRQLESSRSSHYDDDPRSSRYGDDPRLSRYSDDPRPPQYENELRNPRYEGPKQGRYDDIKPSRHEELKPNRYDEPKPNRYEESKKPRYEEPKHSRYEDSKQSRHEESNSSRSTDAKSQEVSKPNSPQTDQNSEFNQLTSEGLLQRIINLSMQNLMSIMYYALTTKEIADGDLPALKKLAKKTEELYANKSIEVECARMQKERKTNVNVQINNSTSTAIIGNNQSMFLASNPPVQANLLLPPQNVLQQPQSVLHQPQNLLLQPQNLLQQPQNLLQQPQQTLMYQQLSASLSVPPPQGSPGFIPQRNLSQNIANTWQGLMNPKPVGNTPATNLNSLYADYMKRL